jgi:predicted flavoprotein YhiN
MTEHFDVIVIGGGASGLLAAGRAAEAAKGAGRAARILILEKNKKMGEKLKITGGGRCNITNAEYDTHELLGALRLCRQISLFCFCQIWCQGDFFFF